MISWQGMMTESENWSGEGPSGQNPVRLVASGLGRKTEPFGAPNNVTPVIAAKPIPSSDQVRCKPLAGSGLMSRA